MKTKEKNKGLNGAVEKKLTSAEKKRIAILKSGQGLFKEEYAKGLIKPFDRK